MSVPSSSAAATPMTRPMAQPSRVWPTAVHSAGPAAWCHRADAVWVMEGNSSARITPAALSPCQRPSAAARTASRSPYRTTFARVTSGVPDHVRGGGRGGDHAEFLHVVLDLGD